MFVIDADAHVMEDEAAWAHLEPEYHARRPANIKAAREAARAGAWAGPTPKAT